MTTLALPAARTRHRDAPRVLDADRLGDHLDRLYRAALGLTGSPTDAEDLVQDVYVRVLAKPRLVTGSDDLGYLLRVLRNTFISGRRTAARRPATATAPEDFERFEARGADPERAVEVRRLYADIAELPDHQRDALVAVDLLGLSYKEAAASLEVPTGTIMSRLFRARQALATA
ncbi:MAG TPA: RNA polymerase sigma factor [Solirubrobacteraceae bacterium]|nr:RNA polymerase sigma factor [Solirubrobacteraceae bacterium]